MVGLVGISRDITERKQMEEALRRHATRMQILAEASKVFAEQTFDYPGVLDTATRNVAGWIGGMLHDPVARRRRPIVGIRDNL